MRVTGIIDPQSWDSIADKHGTDKSSSFHGYMDEYERLLSGRKVERLLEIGVAHGKSLFAWRELLPDALIVGVDIVPDCRLHQRVDIAVLIADASDPSKMAAVSQLHGPFDVVIDDGEHDPDQIRMAFEELYPRMAPGGVYVVEDMEGEWAESFAKRWNGRYVSCQDKGLIIIEKP